MNEQYEHPEKPKRYTIDANKLLIMLETERTKAIAWRDDCAAFEDVKMVMVAEQSILAYNKVIAFVKGMMA